MSSENVIIIEINHWSGERKNININISIEMVRFNFGNENNLD